MKQVAMIGAVLVIATWSFAQSNSKPTTQSQPPAQSTAPATSTSPKRPPQAKTQPEYEAYKTAVALTDAAAAEKAADDFAAKFPDSELRVMLYKSAMRLYQRAGVPEYWIIDPLADPDRPTLRVYRRRGRRWLRPIDVAFGEVYQTPLLPGFELRVDPRA